MTIIHKMKACHFKGLVAAFSKLQATVTSLSDSSLQ